ncbi:NAD(+) diphosphatase [Tessaracoccus flavus]|uniref:NAD(+) diphosphatase n=1 Tax=Tessaracoccus flavus TaxID=1610493 RepID=A0A1Q2CDX4_9ACTN|nr:NAD(+) diphosphatase [Tessaracoccus flavus]AQP44324.1 hypothetical protein RPIT_05440 [Tessaracoccus flavus]SDY66003.1 NAD+ diphosphatase [Tessaracoccus flavus]
MIDWREPSQLDRSPALRAEQDLDAAWRAGRVVEVDESGNISAGPEGVRFLDDPGQRQLDDIFVGTFRGEPWFARPVLRMDGESLAWRDIEPGQADPTATAVALSRWHLQSPPCERCGEATRPDLAGARRTCVGCGHWAFPRTDPCVIVAIRDPDDRLLLARQPSWAPKRFSIIAGFIEAGESAEQACHREVYEEVGVELTHLTYVSSQPWPMPRSLMLGFEARSGSASLRPDGLEIAEARFLSRTELARVVGEGSLVLPPPASIARSLIERWRVLPEVDVNL